MLCEGHPLAARANELNKHSPTCISGREGSQRSINIFVHHVLGMLFKFEIFHICILIHIYILMYILIQFPFYLYKYTCHFIYKYILYPYILHITDVCVCVYIYKTYVCVS